jgi:hypothetical protein
VAALQAAREQAFSACRARMPVEPPVPYPEDTLSYLANVYNQKAAAFYARHGVQAHRRRLREPRRAGRGEPDDHQALRALEP